MCEFAKLVEESGNVLVASDMCDLSNPNLWQVPAIPLDFLHLLPQRLIYLPALLSAAAISGPVRADENINVCLRFWLDCGGFHMGYKSFDNSVDCRERYMWKREAAAIRGISYTGEHFLPFTFRAS
jgi:hypothetical protein